MYTRGNAVGAVPAVMLAALLVLPLPLPSGTAPAPRTFSVWFESATVKVQPQDPAMASTSVWDGSAIRLSAARGEHESFQAVIGVGSPADCLVTLSPLAGPAVLPPGSASFYKVRYPTAVNSQWPDPLEPLTVPSAVALGPGRNDPVLVDIHVPPDAPPGDYFANLTVEAGEGERSTPLVLTVWDIEIPERNTLQTWFDDSSSSWASAFGFSPWSSQHQGLMKNVYTQYKDFRISPGNTALGQVGRYNMSVQNGVVSVDFSGTDPWLEYCLDGLGFPSFRFPLTGYSPRRADMDTSTGHPDSIYFWGAPPYDMNPQYADHVGQYIRLVADHYREKGWLDKAYVYVTDEPIAFNDGVTSYWQHPNYHVVQQFYNLTKANAPDLKFANTVQFVPELFNFTDVWATPGSYYHELDASERISRGQSVWWYNVDAGIASDGVKGRALYWDTFSRGVQGVLYWGTNYWDYDTVNGDPWQGSNSNGDGYLFYPGNKAGINDDVCPSLRLFLARDGIEDFELLNLYGVKYGYEAARAVAESVAVGSSFAGARFRPVDAKTIYEIREWLAGEITRQTADLAWTDTFLDGANVSAATDLVPDTAWEGSRAPGPANPPFIVDTLDSLGGWQPNNQPHIFSSVAIDTAVKTEGTGSLRIDFWRDDDPGELGGYDQMRNGRVMTGSLPITDWSGFDLLEMDVRSVDQPAGNLYMLVGDAQGTVVSSNLHRYARYNGGPGDNWTHVVIDISGKSRSSIQYIEPIVYNYFLEVPYKHYSYWIDNITVRKAGVRPAGTLVSKPIDLGPVGRFDGLEYLSQWDIPAGSSLSFDTRSSADSINWSAWAPATANGRFRAAIASPPARFFQYRAAFGSAGAPPVLSEVRVVYGPLIETDLFVQNMTFDPPVPNDNETFNISVTAGNNGPAGVSGARVQFLGPSGPLGNLSADLASGASVRLSVNASLPALAAGWPISARISLPAEGWTDTAEANNEATGLLVVNDFPSPAVVAPATALVGETVRFSASGSSDDQGIAACRWSFSDTTLEGAEIGRAFPFSGPWDYSLAVTDTFGATSRLDGRIAVFNHTPVPSFVSTPENGTVRTRFTFISTVFDPESTVVNTTWLFGDGMAGFGRLVNHTFADDQDYTVDCTVDFFDNGTLRRASASRVLKVENLPPVASFSVTNDTAGKRELLGFDATASSDPDDELGDSAFNWTFGDGTCATGRMASHAYATAGTFNVTLAVTDDDGASSAFVVPVRIVNQLPVPDFQLPANVTCNRSFTLDATPSRDPDGSLVGYIWEFDDGTCATGMYASHSFALPGIRSVALVVTDDDGGSARLVRTLRADPEPSAPPGRPAVTAPSGIHPAIWVGAALLAVLLVVLAVSRARRRPGEVSRWTMARHASGPGAPASARGPPPSVEAHPAILLGEPAGPIAPAAGASPFPASSDAPPPAAAAPSALAAAPFAPPPVPPHQPPRVVRTIPPPPPRLVRSLPPPTDAGDMDIESERPAKVIGRTEPRKAAGRPPPVQDEPKGDEADPTLPSNPWAERRT